MEEDAPLKRSVAELAGKFKNTEQDQGTKPIRRRPPRSLKLPTHPPAEQEKPDGATSPFSGKPSKRNSALIEKLQANLLLSPAALLPSPKSPGMLFMPPSFPPFSSCDSTSPPSPVATVTPVTPTLLAQSEEEVPASFETPASTTEGAILPNINKGRARLSIKRRPPSRRNRTSSNGDQEGESTGKEDTPPVSPGEPEAKPAGEETAERNEEAIDPEVTAEDVCSPTDTSPAQAQNSPEPISGAGVRKDRGDEGGGQPRKDPGEHTPTGEEEGGEDGSSLARSQARLAEDGVSHTDMAAAEKESHDDEETRC